MEEGPLLIQKKHNVVTLTLNRPEKKNSLSPELVKIMLQTLKELSTDESMRVVVIRGSGEKAFCAGYDIRSLPTKRDNDVAEKMQDLSPVELLFKTVVSYPYPTIAMINGAAFGAGCELAVCCDIRIGADDISIGMPPAKLGLVYPWSGLQRFIQTIGDHNTREIFFTGRTYQGNRLKALGLVNYLVPAGELESFTYHMASEIAANAPMALKGIKRILNLLSPAELLGNGHQKEAESIAEAAFLSEDLKEGQLAFFEKRKPKFKGR